MKALSTSTNASDPYRAGVELGEALLPIKPEIVFLFSTVHYGQPQEVVEGLYDALENENLVVIGNSGDGFFETKGVEDVGVAALALNSGGAVQWEISSQAGLLDEPQLATKTLLDRLVASRTEELPKLVYMVGDFKTDASEVGKAVEQETRFPIVGGFAADDNKMESCVLFCNRQAMTDAVVGVAAYGELAFDIIISNALTPIGKPGLVDEAEGTNIIKIDGVAATAFIERETGKPVLQTDRGITTLTIIDSDQPEIQRLRSIVPNFSQTDEALGLFGGIERGRTVQVCLAEPTEIVREVYELAARQKQAGFEAIAGVLVSCVGRKWLLGPEIRHELLSLTKEFGTELPIAGFPSFGEIGPVKVSGGYSRNLFHNMTCITLLFGS